MLLISYALVVSVASSTKTTASLTSALTTPRTVTKYGDNACGSASTPQIWTVDTPSENNFVECTTVSFNAPDISTTTTITTTTITTATTTPKPEPVFQIPSLALLARGNTYQELHLICNQDGSYSLGVYQQDEGFDATCKEDLMQEMFHFSGLDQLENLVRGNCAVSDSGSVSFRIEWDGVSLPANCTPIPSATGDPHLINMHGDKFDIHDGLHRFVHYPRDAPEEEALLKVDAHAVEMGQSSDCYDVYLQSIRLSGTWIGDEITVSANMNSSMDISSPSNFGISFARKKIDWPTLNRSSDTHLSLKGSRPVYLHASSRSATSDAQGGEDLTFRVGDTDPTIFEVWSSHGQNPLTHGEQIRFLNVEAKKLPQGSGGIIGVDSYIRPSTSRCGLVKEEKDLLAYILKETRDMSLVQRKRGRFQWAAKAIVQ